MTLPLAALRRYRTAAPHRARLALARIAAPAPDLSPVETAALVALGQAQLDGRIENVRPFARRGEVRFRIEAVVTADQVPDLLRVVGAATD